MEVMDFYIDRQIEMDFIIKSNATPIYINNATMVNKLKIDSRMNYRRYRRIEEIKSFTLGELKNRTLNDISIERG